MYLKVITEAGGGASGFKIIPYRFKWIYFKPRFNLNPLGFNVKFTQI